MIKLTIYLSKQLNLQLLCIVYRNV